MAVGGILSLVWQGDCAPAHRHLAHRQGGHRLCGPARNQLKVTRQIDCHRRCCAPIRCPICCRGGAGPGIIGRRLQCMLFLRRWVGAAGAAPSGSRSREVFWNSVRNWIAVPRTCPSISGSNGGVRPLQDRCDCRVVAGLTPKGGPKEVGNQHHRRLVMIRSPSSLMDVLLTKVAVRRLSGRYSPGLEAMIPGHDHPPAPATSSADSSTDSSAPAPRSADTPGVILHAPSWVSAGVGAARPGQPAGFGCRAGAGRSGWPVRSAVRPAAACCRPPCCGCRFSPDALLVWRRQTLLRRLPLDECCGCGPCGGRR